MINRNLLLALSFAGLSTTSYAQEPADYWQQFKKAKQLCEQNKFNDALAILEALEKSKADYNIELVLGDTYSAQGKLAQALSTYQLALEHGTAAKNSVIERVALFKMGRVQLALKNYPAAAAIYHRLLATKLDKQDDAVARQGYQTAHDNAVKELLEKARLLIDKNEGKQAYQLIKPHLVEENAFSFYIIAAQAKAIMNEPLASFNYFKKAQLLSANLPEQRIALLGMIKMQLALKNLSLVEDYFRQLQQYVKEVKESSFLQKIAAIKEQIKELKLELLIKKAQSYLDQNEGGKSFALIKADLYTAPNYLLYMIAAESMSIQNRPQQALEYYQSAFQHSANDKQQKNALLGIARMQFWLAQYVRAKDRFTRLLHYNLSAQEYQKALAGLVKSYAYYDRPQKAYQQIPSTLVFKAPELIIAAAQASSWAGWSDISKTILHDYQPVLEGSDLSSGLTKDWQDLIWQTDLDTWPNIITPTFFASRDTETFHKKQVTLDYRHYWSYAAQTSFGPEFIDYSQYNFYALNATGFYLSQSIQPNRHLSLIGKIEPMAYKDQTVLQHPSWNPVLWMAKGTVNPNDYIKLNLLAQKEIIETFPAFYNRISDNQYAGTLTLSPLAYLKLDGSLSRLNISDDNIRQGYFLATTLVANPDLGLSTTVIYRGFSNEFKSPDYFSPHHYKEKKILLRLGRRLGATWHYYLDGGLGRQYITPLVNTETNSSPTYQWGMGINGPLTKHLFVTFYYINTHQASAFIDSVGYAYQCGGLSFNLLT